MRAPSWPPGPFSQPTHRTFWRGDECRTRCIHPGASSAETSWRGVESIPAPIHRIAATALSMVLLCGPAQNGNAQPVERHRNEAPRPASKHPTKRTTHVSNAVWIPGFWDLHGDPATGQRAGWVWTPGRWITTPMPGAHWVPGDWGWQHEWWSWIPGHWETNRAANRASPT
jgi:hypothetical protein